MKRISLLLFSLLVSTLLGAQTPRLHSHNDYDNVVPFYLAYSQGVESIECDMFYTEGQLYVGHDWEDINKKFTFERLYVNPIVDFYYRNDGRAWAGSDKILQLMLDVKSDDTRAYIKALIKILKKHPTVFNPELNPYACRIVVTGGDIPSDEELKKLPPYILFDGRLSTPYTELQKERIYMISNSINDFCSWKGGKISEKDAAAIKACIAEAHAMGKPLRFWSTRDTEEVWDTLRELGVDFIGTDRVIDLARHFAK